MNIKLNNFKNKILWSDSLEFLNPFIFNFLISKFPEFIIMLEFDNETFILKNNSKIIVVKDKIKNILNSLK